MKEYLSPLDDNGNVSDFEGDIALLSRTPPEVMSRLAEERLTQASEMWSSAALSTSVGIWGVILLSGTAGYLWSVGTLRQHQGALLLSASGIGMALSWGVWTLMKTAFLQGEAAEDLQKRFSAYARRNIDHNKIQEQLRTVLVNYRCSKIWDREKAEYHLVDYWKKRIDNLFQEDSVDPDSMD